jgi:excisionase family DNA binding protein
MSGKKETNRPKPGSLKYAAAQIGCSLPTLYELIAAGKLRSYHIGRAHRVGEQAIADCIALLEQESAEMTINHSCPPATVSSSQTHS